MNLNEVENTILETLYKGAKKARSVADTEYSKFLENRGDYEEKIRRTFLWIFA